MVNRKYIQNKNGNLVIIFTKVFTFVVVLHCRWT